MGEGLKVKSINILESTNGPEHHTDDYESDALIIRRGQPFYLELIHEGNYDDSNTFYVELKTGKNPKKRNSTLVEVQKEAPAQDEWSYQLKEFSAISPEEGKIKICVNVPSNTLVSSYTLTVISTFEKDGKREKREFALEKLVYILFNPWCKDDEVYMENEEWKKEYVMNDTGLQFVSGKRGVAWNFGQFTDAALKCSFKLLEAQRVNWRDTAREVARHMSSKINSCDNDGLLVGNWSGDYKDGMKPWQWVGSVKIFKKYLETGEPVKYGQCWVFSGLTTSVMRCLGIPTRSVTNYDSAHDSDNNCTIDKYYDENLNYLDESDDSTWNFHVWNDVWMTRPDLAAGLGGWQAIDATPQEESRGLFRCGPASLQSVKEGNVNHSYDARFVFAEVNADTVYWKKKANNELEAMEVNKNSIGTAILTKKPNSWQTEDVTHQYKHPEGSILERATVKNALKKAKNPLVAERVKDVSFSASVPSDIGPEAGILVSIKATNKSANAMTVNSAVVAHVVRYNGVKLKTLTKRTEEKKLGGKEDVNFDFKYDPSELLDHLDENISIRFSIMSKVKENEQVFVLQQICNIHKPELTLEAVGNASGKVKSEDTLTVKITVPSIHGLTKYTGCSLEVESPVIEDVTLPIPDAVADGTASIEKSFTIKRIRKERETKLGITFNCNEISGVHGSMQLHATV